VRVSLLTMWFNGNASQSQWVDGENHQLPTIA
jgi:hypothetical protein